MRVTEPLGDEERRRLRLLEEALAECVLWISQQDIVDDQFDEATQWTERLDEVEEVQALLERADAALAPADFRGLIGRAAIRRRAEVKKQDTAPE